MWTLDYKGLTWIVICCFIGFGAVAQTTVEQGTAALAKTVVMRELQPLNDPNFVPRQRKRANVRRSATAPITLAPARPSTQQSYEAEVVATVTNTEGRSQMINEAPCLTYQGMSGGPGYIPPDVAGAVGHDHIYSTENDSFRIQDKYGNVLQQQLHQDGAGLWSGLWSVFLFDPKIIYDPYANRWIHVILAEGDTTLSSILIAVSQTADPQGGWSIWTIDADVENDQWFDYPLLGFNNKWLVIGGVVFPTSDGSTAEQASRTFVFQLSQLYAGSGLNYWFFTNASYNHLTPALTYDPAMNDIWLVTNNSANDDDLRFFKIAGPTNAPAFTEEGTIAVTPGWSPGGADIAPQLGTAARINAGDHRVLSAMWRDGNLHSSQTVFLPVGGSPSTATIQYVKCNPGTNTLVEAVRFNSDANSMYAFPNLVVNQNGDIIMSCARFTNTTYPSACTIVRRFGDPQWYETTYKAGEDWYVNFDNANPVRNRWGDYTTCAIDPSDDQSVWVCSEYSRPKVSSTNGQWGTWWARICSGVCQSIVTVNTPQNAGTIKKFEAQNIVFGNNHINNGAYIKFDAGSQIILQPGFRAWEGSKLRAFVEGCSGPQ